MIYDRAKLLHCQTALECGLDNISLIRSRINEHITNNTEDTIQVIHAEIMCSWTRVAVKLASTLPPECKLSYIDEIISHMINTFNGHYSGMKLAKLDIHVEQ